MTTFQLQMTGCKRTINSYWWIVLFFSSLLLCSTLVLDCAPFLQTQLNNTCGTSSLHGDLLFIYLLIYLLINEWGWVSYEQLWRSRRVLRPRWITRSEISIILHMIRKQNSIIVLLFIQNNSLFKNIANTSLPESMLSLSSIVYV